MPVSEAIQNRIERNVAAAANLLFAPEVRRFELPDMDRHASWFMPRFLKEFPHLNERSAIGFLRGIIYSNEFLFLFQDKGVALAQSMGSGGLEPEPIVWERFVWVEDPANVEQQKAAAFFYPRMEKWAKGLGVRVIHVENKSDVGHELIKAQMGRIYETSQKYLRA
jgi:hypothetical protein